MKHIGPRRKLRVGQIGVGGFGSHRRYLMRETGLFDLVAAFDHSPAALAVAEAEDGARPMRSYEEMLDFPGLEAVVISTGARYHATQAIDAMERGLAVFVEKPLCSNVEDALRIREVQERTGAVVGVGHLDHATDAVSLTIKDLLESGELGDVVAFEKTTAHSGGFQIRLGDWRGDAESNPGGMLFQCGVHGLHELAFYFGPLEEVQAVMRFDIHTTKTADAALCLLKFQSGVVGNLNAYHLTAYRHSLNIFGTKATVYRDDRFFNEGTIFEIQKMRLDNSLESKSSIPLVGHSDPAGNLRNFYAAVVDGSEPSPSLRDGLQAVMAVFAAEASAKSGKAVRLDSFGLTRPQRPVDLHLV